MWPEVDEEDPSGIWPEDADELTRLLGQYRDILLGSLQDSDEPEVRLKFQEDLGAIERSLARIEELRFESDDDERDEEEEDGEMEQGNGAAPDVDGAVDGELDDSTS